MPGYLCKIHTHEVAAVDRRRGPILLGFSRGGVSLSRQGRSPHRQGSSVGAIPESLPGMKTCSLLLLAVAILAVVVDVSAQQPRSEPPPAASSKSIPAGNIEHGRYLVERVIMCAECHSPRDEHGNIIEEQRFMGAPVPVKPWWPNDWAERAPRNRGLPGYTVEQGIRLLTEGAIGRDGRQLRPPMPRFHMTTQDAADVVAYMKSLQ
jgi:mono/diheme cytochrome c family protein